jgi:deoxyribonuclease-4
VDRPLVGSHVDAAGGLATRGLAHAAGIGAEVIQVFVSNPRGWSRSPGEPAEDQALARAGLPVYVHAPYLVNLGSGDPGTAARSAEAVRHELDRAARLGARGVVVHAGSAGKWDRDSARDWALRQVGDLLLPLLDKLGEDDPGLLIEPMAGQGQSLCSRVEELGPYLEALQWHPRAGLCLDTCHLFAAGHDLTAPGAVPALLAAVDRAAPGRVRLVHANDSAYPCGSRRDRHAAIGTGLIGPGPFRELIRHPLLADVPFVAETPKASQGSDVAALRQLRDCDPWC